MNALLKRQLRKHLQNQGVDYKEDLDVFLNAVSSSYTNYEEQLAMVQRAMALSSDELYEANEKRPVNKRRLLRVLPIRLLSCISIVILKILIKKLKKPILMP